MKLVEGPLLGAHLLVAAPRLGNHHHDRVRELPSGEQQHLERVVEHRRVAAVGIDHGQDLRDLRAEQPGLEHAFAGVHPVDVPAQRVDLAVVADVAVRVRAPPARKGVGAEAGVHQRERRLELRVQDVRIEGRELVGLEHSLVDDRARGQARQVERRGRSETRSLDRALRLLADDVETAVEGRRVLDLRAAPDEHLADRRLARLRRPADHRVVGGDRAPAEQRLPLAAHHLLEDLLAAAALAGVGGEEDHPGAVAPRAGKLDPEPVALPRQKAVRELEQDSRAVAGVLLTAAGAPVPQAHQDLEAASHDLVGLAALHVGDEADAAGVVLESGIV